MQDLTPYPVLVVDDEPDNLDAFRFNFRKGFQVLTAGSGEEALGLLGEHDVAVLVTDQRMPKMNGLELLKAAQPRRPDAVPIILTAFTDVDVLVDAINMGQIYRYITKPWDAKEVRGILTQAIERFRLMRENRKLAEQLREFAGYLQREAHGDFDFGEIIGEASALGEVLRRVEQVAPTSSSVLLRGETGTGKELVARAIHINSPREAKPFVRVHCAQLAPGVLESELFGHEKGAFTGAIARRAGRFELADGGTLFLDEVGDLPMEVQIKLLRAVQEREFERVGGTETLRVDVRLISATHRDLEAMIARGEFREDLYYRLNVFPIDLPALRERPTDIALLAEHFVAKFARQQGKRVRGLDAGARARLGSYAWPGNVRELGNVIERAMIVTQGPSITEGDLDFGRRGARTGTNTGTNAGTGTNTDTRTATATATATATDADTDTRTKGPATLADRLGDQERAEILAAIDQAGSNIASAARALGINRSTLYYRLRKHGLEHLLPTKIDQE